MAGSNIGGGGQREPSTALSVLNETVERAWLPSAAGFGSVQRLARTGGGSRSVAEAIFKPFLNWHNSSPLP